MSSSGIPKSKTKAYQIYAYQNTECDEQYDVQAPPFLCQISQQSRFARIAMEAKLHLLIAPLQTIHACCCVVGIQPDLTRSHFLGPVIFRRSQPEKSSRSCSVYVRPGAGWPEPLLVTRKTKTTKHANTAIKMNITTKYKMRSQVMRQHPPTKPNSATTEIEAPRIMRGHCSIFTQALSGSFASQIPAPMIGIERSKVMKLIVPTMVLFAAISVRSRLGIVCFVFWGSVINTIMLMRRKS
ncbi:hypothetical protein V6N12_013150 [Hibiscus sabdariffa]|uniref:Uncharacterized protein n=1 Tax=Hibiscus sabdariffa TaxID=183260 RepID=A0ABR1ZNZ9_9ROSI